MDAGFIIRFHYHKKDPRFFQRYMFFKSKVLPRIKEQTYKDFDVYVWCNPLHDELFQKLGCNTFHAPDKRRYNVSGYYHDFIRYEETEGLPKLEVQMGLDSDDFIKQNYVKIIMDSVQLHKKNNSEKSLHICFQPQLFAIKNKRITAMRRYSARKGSAFMALYQPENKKYRFIYSESHVSIIRRADCSKHIPEGYCYAVKHDINETTGKTISEIKKNKIILV
jgi:hypothetical protein